MSWQRSSFCNLGNCVEVNREVPGTVAVRSSTGTSSWLVVSTDEWATFIEGVKAGEFG